MSKGINVVLGLVGLVIMAMGVNVGMGGIPTLGWFGSDEFILVAGTEVYDVNDNHIRFLGGVWFGVGAAFLVGCFKIEQLRQTLIYLCMVISIAGLFRFSAMNFDVVFSAALAPSLAFEIIGFPLLAWWLLAGNKMVIVIKNS